VSDAAEAARDMASEQTERAKGAVADEVSSVAHALRTAADDLREGSAQERTFAQIADTLADTAEAIRGKDLGEMVREATDMARRHPMTFLGGAALLGFTAVRFAKASRDDVWRRRPGSRPGSTGSRHGVTPTPVDPGTSPPPRCEVHVMTDQTHTANKSAAGLLTDAIAHMSALVRKEVDLARAEVSENVTRAGVAVGLLAAALVIALTALNVLAAALVAGLAEWGLGAGWAALLVGVVLGVIAFALAMKAKNDLKLTNIAPSRTAKNVQRDAQAIKEVTTNDHD
jgi:hypothetical protein